MKSCPNPQCDSPLGIVNNLCPDNPHWTLDQALHWMQCTTCGMQGPHTGERAAAETAWNDLPRRTAVDQRNLLMAKLYDDGLSYESVAMFYNVATSTAYRRILKHRERGSD